MDFENITCLEMGKMIREKKLGCVEAVSETLKRIRERDGQINAYTLILEDEAISTAKKIQERIDNGEVISPIAGVPVAIKDNISTKGATTTCSSKILYNYKPVYNATATQRLEDAGAVIVGKLNMDEFAMGGSTETSYQGVTKNPWNTECVPGGSSGGGAAAVAAGEAVVALGSDTGGSIRQPCSFCGITGIKPTYGSVSRYGLIAYASSLDQIGPMGKNIEDCCSVLSIVSGWDEKDSTSINKPALDFRESFGSTDLRGLTVGVPVNYLSQGIDDDVKQSVLEAIEHFRRLGATVLEFELPAADYSVAAYYIIACAEASSNLSRFDGIKYGYKSADAANLIETYVKSRSEGFGTEVKRRIMLGSFVLSTGYYDAYYKKAMQVRRIVKEAFDDAFSKYDLLIAPTAPTTAYKIGTNSKDPLKMYMGDMYTVSANLAGIPGVALPCGFDKNGMPIGMQLLGKAFSEPVLAKAAYAFQQTTEFHLKKPILVGEVSR